MKARLSILSTAPIGNDVTEDIQDESVALDIVPFITIEYNDELDARHRIKAELDKKKNIVFTSKHAVASVARFTSDVATASWSVYCIGGNTKRAVSELLRRAKIVGVAKDAADLAVEISKNKESEVVFFSGDKRLDILPDALRADGINVEEVIVYMTVETPTKIEREYDGILFFSPSGVSSFFTANNVSQNTRLFAIGDTTAAALNNYTNNQIIVSASPDKRQVFMTAVAHLQKEINERT